MTWFEDRELVHGALHYVIPKAPFLYVNDPTLDSAFVSKLIEVLPKTLHIALSKSPHHSTAYLSTLKNDQRRDTIYIFSDNQADSAGSTKKTAADLVRQAAIRVGSNFASINFVFDASSNAADWGSNHIDLVLTGRSDYVLAAEVQNQVQEVVEWLFKTLNVKDTLHLVSADEMLQTNEKMSFHKYKHKYKYSRIGDYQQHPKDNRIYFIGLVVSEPVVTSAKELTWQVVDKSGVVDMRYTWRTPKCQSTWDWALSLKPGDRECFPLMSFVIVKETLLTTVVKAPVRVPGAVIRGTGITIGLIGFCVHRLGKVMQMGKRKKWIAEPDIEEYRKRSSKRSNNVKVVKAKSKPAANPLGDKGNKTWTDNDSSHSTLQEEHIEKTSSTPNKKISDMLE